MDEPDTRAAPRVHCPECGKRFRVDPGDLAEKALRVPARCSRCGISFRVRVANDGGIEAFRVDKAERGKTERSPAAAPRASRAPSSRARSKSRAAFPAKSSPRAAAVEETDDAGFGMGERIGRYEIETLFGRGGMAAVYRAFDPAANRHVALKVLSADAHAEDLARFRREVEVQGNIQHPHIMPIFDSGTIGRSRYFAMEVLKNPISLATLVEKVRDGRAARDPTLRSVKTLEGLLTRILLPVCDAVHHANVREGVIHRDLKPENILVDVASMRPLVIDFGICSVVERKNQRLAHLPTETPQRLEGGGVRVTGTLVYMPPEQARGRVDRRGDVWALGAILHTMLTGSPPLAPAVGGNVRTPDRIEGLRLLAERAERAQKGEEATVFRDRLTRLDSGSERGIEVLQREVLDGNYLPLPTRVPRPLRAIVHRAMSPEPERRYRHAGALKEDLQRWLSGRPVRAVTRRMNPARALAYRTTLLVRRHRRAVALLVAAVGIGALTLGVALGGGAGETGGRSGAAARLAEARELEESGASAERVHRAAETAIAAGAKGRSALDLLDRSRQGMRLEAALARGEVLAREVQAGFAEVEARVAFRRLARLRELLYGEVVPARAGGGWARDDADRIATLVALAREARPLRVVGADVPNGLRLRAFPVRDRERVRWAEGRDVAEATGLAPGRWVLVLHRGGGEVHLPLWVVPGVKPFDVACPVDPAALPSGKVYVLGGSAQTAFGNATVPPLLWDRVEVSAARYAAYLDDLSVAERGQRAPRVGGSREEAGTLLWAGSGAVAPDDAVDLPVEGISLRDASAFAGHVGERLPSAIEWSWAATAGLGLRTAMGSLDCVAGEEIRIDRLALGARAVGTTPCDKSPFGVLDLTGNVAEMTGTMRTWDGTQGWLVLGSGYAHRLVQGLVDRAFARPGWATSQGVGFRLVRPLEESGR